MKMPGSIVGSILIFVIYGAILTLLSLGLARLIKPVWSATPNVRKRTALAFWGLLDWGATFWWLAENVEILRSGALPASGFIAKAVLYLGIWQFFGERSIESSSEIEQEENSEQPAIASASQSKELRPPNLVLYSRLDGWGRTRISLTGIMLFFGIGICTIFMLISAFDGSYSEQYIMQGVATLTITSILASIFWIISGLVGWIYRGFAEKEK